MVRTSLEVLLVTIYYPPVISSLSTMMQDVAEGLSTRGHNVTVATAKPHDDLNLTPNARKIAFDTFSTEKDIRVIRVNTPPLKNKIYHLRGLIQLMLPHIFLKYIRKYSRDKFDIVIVSTPPLPLAMLGSKIKKKYGCKYILSVQDIYPQSVIDVGVMKNKIIIKIFEYFEHSVYRSSDCITSHTQGNRNFIIKNKNIPTDKIFYIPNWIDVTPYINIRKTGLYRDKYGLEDKFIFLFAGVIGPGQGLNLLINALALAKNIPADICFLIVGEGSEKKNLEKIVKDYSLKNIYFKPFVSLEDYPFLVKDADIGLVCLDSRLKTPVVPGKLLGFMASSLPVIALLNKESDGHILIREAGCGYSIDSDAGPEDISSLIKNIYNERDKMKQYGKKGHLYVLRHFEKNMCIDKINSLMKTIT